MLRKLANHPLSANPEFVEGVKDARAASRRGFLGRSLVAAVAGGALLAGRRARAQATEAFPELYPGANYSLFNEIRLDEEAHVAYLLQALGGSARPKPTFQNLTSTSLYEFGGLSVTFENVGVHAYLGAIGSINNRALLAGVATVATVEARHASYLNALGDNALVPYGVPFDFPYTQQQVIDAVTPFVASLNGGPPLAFDTSNLSAANDVAIGNFALALEYLEMEFYDTNVPFYY